jgi:putative membrane protein
MRLDHIYLTPGAVATGPESSSTIPGPPRGVPPLAPRVVVAPAGTALALVFVAGGIGLGTLSGLVPGLHVNNLALLLAAVAPAVPGPPRFVGAAMLAAGTVHTFLDVVPALALGVPDAAMAASALPGHRLVLEGRGREALRLSALGSGLAVAVALPLAVPVTAAMRTLYPVLQAHLSVLLAGVAALLVLTDGAPVAAAVCFAASAALGHATLPLEPSGLLPTGDVLAPLFAGLFGAPVLLDALDGGGVPEQDDATVAQRPTVVALTACAGTAAGAAVGYLPGVSSAVAAVVALAAAPDGGPRSFVVATSGANTATAVFALFALVAFRTPRSGVLVAFQRARLPLELPLLLASVVLAAAVGAVLVPTLGDRYLRTVGRADHARLSVGVLALLVVLSYGFAGSVGIAVLLVATLVGLLPVRLGARRVTLMGVLLGPLAL